MKWNIEIMEITKVNEIIKMVWHYNIENNIWISII